jgi:hypothetical protein
MWFARFQSSKATKENKSMTKREKTLEKRIISNDLKLCDVRYWDDSHERTKKIKALENSTQRAFEEILDINPDYEFPC